jgi:hypothetical protein
MWQFSAGAKMLYQQEMPMFEQTCAYFLDMFDFKRYVSWRECTSSPNSNRGHWNVSYLTETKRDRAESGRCWQWDSGNIRHPRRLKGFEWFCLRHLEICGAHCGSSP